MTKEEKDKLLKYLCMALPYKVKVHHPDYDEPQTLDTIFTPEAYSGGAIRCDVDDNWEKPHTLEDCKPYLRTMSSMTREEYKSIVHILGEHRVIYKANNGFELNKIKTCSPELIDWLLEHHFDFMGLIPIDLAIVTEENNPYKD